MLVDKPHEMKRPADVLPRLIRERHIGRYGLFGVTGEGRELPDGSESASGYLVDELGRVYFFWLDWDHVRGEAAFIKWRQVEPQPDWDDDQEYREAREAAGFISA